MYYVITGVIVRGYEPPLILNSSLSSCNVQETHCICTPANKHSSGKWTWIEDVFPIGNRIIFQPATTMLEKYQLPSSRFVCPRYRKPMFALAPWQREAFYWVKTSPPNPAEYWRSDWHSGMFLGWCWSYLLVLEQMCQITFLHLCAPRNLLTIPFLKLPSASHVPSTIWPYVFFTNIAFVCLQTILPYNHKLGGGFKDFLLSSLSLGRWSNLTSIFFKWVGSTTNETIILPIFAVTVDPPEIHPFSTLSLRGFYRAPELILSTRDQSWDSENW